VATRQSTAKSIATALAVLNQQVIECRLCPRLVEHRERVAREKRGAYLGWTYWGRPVPSFGDPGAGLLIIGLAPGAHGANRTGRMFTGDRSGDFLYRALWQTGFANQPESTSREDGLVLSGAYITSPVRCAPPDNKPEREEILRCQPFFDRELRSLHQVRVVVALGGIAFENYLSALQRRGLISTRAAYRFAHGAEYETHAGGPVVLCSYHPSQQNTSTGRLTADMLRGVFARARLLLDAK
jgi:uracil-DNA glycosylase